MHVFISPLPRLRARDFASALLRGRWRWRGGTLVSLRPSLFRFCLLRATLRWRGRCLRSLLLIVLPHYFVTRLIPVILALKRLLLLHSRISVS